jgi:hypothetical protein
MKRPPSIRRFTSVLTSAVLCAAVLLLPHAQAPAHGAAANGTNPPPLVPLPAGHPALNPTNTATAPGSTPKPRPTWWSFAPLATTPPPAVSRADWGRTPVDAFILARLEAKKLSPSPRADRATLLRRAYLDLLGLPPTPEEVQAYVQDLAPDPEAWNALVGRLLQRPEHGERWARYWLDVARFAESSGFEHDYDRPAAYHYRDFVIRALNEDLPFDQFVRWQIAGDEFEPDNPQALMATGFLGAGVFPTQITANEVERTRYDAMDDMLATTGTAMLGITIGCARCHDHKSDPFTAQDYYRLLATFTTTVRSELDLDLDPAAHRRAKEAFDTAHAPLTQALKAYETRDLPGRFDAWLASGAPLPSRPAWKTLSFSTTRSDAGATFRRLDDGSYLAEGKNGDSDRYTFSTELRETGIQSLRLEALPDAGLVHGGPGRADNGNFALSRIRVFTSPLDGSTTNEVALVRPRATFQQNSNHLGIAASLDDNPQSGWAIDPKFGTANAAGFEFAQAIGHPDGLRFTVVLEFKVNTRHNLGHLRLSVGSEPSPDLEGNALPAPIASLLAKLKTSTDQSRTDLAPAERETLRDWWRHSDPGWRKLAEAVEAHARTAPQPKRTKVLTCTEGNTPVRMHTQGADFFPETHILQRGSTDLKRGVATQAFPAVLSRATEDGPGTNRWSWQPPAGAKFSGRRRTLSNWMTDTDHGAGHLLARVIVNRLWQHHFGRGLVETPNDFGAQGSRPTHPELLDWLAGELIRQGWRLRPIHQLLMTSAVYQQATTRAETRTAEVSPEDPADYRSFQPRRLEAEAIRDSVLAVCGVLDKRPFGPGTLDEASTRRSIYFTVKRSQLVPAMQVFDVPEPLVSQGTRPATTVAPQALLFLNSPHLRTWAARFAERIAPRAETPFSEAAQRAFAFALGRAPTPNELTAATAFLERQSTTYRGAHEPARARTLALTDFTQAMLGLNEFVYVQ